MKVYSKFERSKSWHGWVTIRYLPLEKAVKKNQYSNKD